MVSVVFESVPDAYARGTPQGHRPDGRRHLCWATAGVLVRNMEITDGWKITFWRSSIMTVFLLVVLSFQHGSRLLYRVHAMDGPGWYQGCCLRG